MLNIKKPTHKFYLFSYRLGFFLNEKTTVKTKLLKANSIEDAIAKFKHTCRNSATLIQITILDSIKDN